MDSNYILHLLQIEHILSELNIGGHLTIKIKALQQEVIIEEKIQNGNTYQFDPPLFIGQKSVPDTQATLSFKLTIELTEDDPGPDDFGRQEFNVRFTLADFTENVFTKNLTVSEIGDPHIKSSTYAFTFAMKKETDQVTIANTRIPPQLGPITKTFDQRYYQNHPSMFCVPSCNYLCRISYYQGDCLKKCCFQVDNL